MNPAETIPDTWAARQWWWAVGLVFVGQLLLVFLLSDRAPTSPRPAAEATTLSLALDSVSNERLNDPLLVGDPTLFALANPRGFSGRAWLVLPSLEHPLAGWTEPPGWLAATASSPLGDAFFRFVATNATALFHRADKPAPQLMELATVPEPLPLKSTLRVEGALKARPFATQPALPSLPYEDVLRPSMVQVLVKPDGEIFSTTLLGKGSGLKAADDRALEQAKAVRFQPLKPGGTAAPAAFTTGTLVFTWHTATPAAPPPP